MTVELVRSGFRFVRRLLETSPPPTRQQLEAEFRQTFHADPYDPNVRELVLRQVEALRLAFHGAFFVDSANIGGASYNPIVQFSARAAVLAAEFGISNEAKPQS